MEESARQWVKNKMMILMVRDNGEEQRGRERRKNEEIMENVIKIWKEPNIAKEQGRNRKRGEESRSKRKREGEKVWEMMRGNKSQGEER